MQHLAAVERDRDALEVDDVLAEPRGGELLERHPVAHRRHIRDELVGGVDAELRLARARRCAPAQPRELLAHEVLPLRLGCRRHPVALDALQHVGGVAALERLDDAVVHLPGVGRDLVEEPAVVGDHHEAALSLRPARLQMLGEPGDALDVEVVGGLVEEHDVPVAAEQGCERHAAPLAARELADPRVPGEVAQQAADDVAHLRVPRPLVLGTVADDGVVDRLVLGQAVGLVEHAYAGAAAHGDAPGIRLLAAREDAQQRRLAVAVAAHDADAVALADAEGHGVEDDLGRVLEVKRFRADEMSHTFSLVVRSGMGVCG